MNYGGRYLIQNGDRVLVERTAEAVNEPPEATQQEPEAGEHDNGEAEG